MKIRELLEHELVEQTLFDRKLERVLEQINVAWEEEQFTKVSQIAEKFMDTIFGGYYYNLTQFNRWIGNADPKALGEFLHFYEEICRSMYEFFQSLESYGNIDLERPVCGLFIRRYSDPHDWELRIPRSEDIREAIVDQNIYVTNPHSTSFEKLLYNGSHSFVLRHPDKYPHIQEYMQYAAQSRYVEICFDDQRGNTVYLMYARY